MTPEEKLRHWEDTFRGMRLYPFFVHEPYCILQIAHPGDERSLAASIYQLGEKLKAYAVELLGEAGALRSAMGPPAPMNPAFPPQAPEFAQPMAPVAQSAPAAPAPQFPPAARRGRGEALPPGIQEVPGAGPSFSFLAPPAPGAKPSVA
jgi:hypothetical protein